MFFDDFIKEVRKIRYGMRDLVGDYPQIDLMRQITDKDWLLYDLYKNGFSTIVRCIYKYIPDWIFDLPDWFYNAESFLSCTWNSPSMLLFQGDNGVMVDRETAIKRMMVRREIKNRQYSVSADIDWCMVRRLSNIPKAVWGFVTKKEKDVADLILHGEFYDDRYTDGYDNLNLSRYKKGTTILPTNLDVTEELYDDAMEELDGLEKEFQIHEKLGETVEVVWKDGKTSLKILDNVKSESVG